MLKKTTNKQQETTPFKPALVKPEVNSAPIKGLISSHLINHNLVLNVNS